MNELQKALFDAPSIATSLCPFCGKRATNRHHIIPRSQGGHNGPTVDVCGMGNASGCHGKLHNHTLHLRYKGGWEFLETDEPTKYQDALAMDGWHKVFTFDEFELLRARKEEAWERIGFTGGEDS